MEQPNGVSRRSFVKTGLAASAALGAMSAPSIMAQGTKKLKVGLIGCGGRGKGALANHLEAAKHRGIEIDIVALADPQADRLEGAAQQFEVAASKCFSGFKGYHDLLEAGPDIVLMATPPVFRPLHLEACIEAGKHVFIEKPVAVDPPGARKIIAVGEKAKEKGLSIVAGTQRRHQKAYHENKHQIDNGAVGEIVGGTVMWNGGRLWYKPRNEGESDESYMIRNWVSFAEMSGDHITEQHVHNIDVANWFIGRTPIAAMAFGGRARRRTGNQFDFFSVDFNYGKGVNIHSMCRQVDGCYGRVGEFFRGTEGEVFGGGRIKSYNKATVENPVIEEFGGPYTHEHVDLLDSIVQGTPVNEAENVATSTMSALMGRISAYTGQLIRWTDLTANKNSPYYDLTLSPSPEDFENGTVKAPDDDVFPIPGKD